MFLYKYPVISPHSLTLYSIGAGFPINTTICDCVNKQHRRIINFTDLKNLHLFDFIAVFCVF